MGSKPEKASKKAKADAEVIRKYCLSFPETHEDHPWGESAFKVKSKTFVFMGFGDDGMGFSVKLTHSLFDALALPFAEPTGYGLGKSGWVSFTFNDERKLPVDQVKQWIEESYRAVAPKTILKKMDSPK